MKRMKGFALLWFLILTAIVIAACGSSSQQPDDYTPEYAADNNIAAEEELQEYQPTTEEIYPSESEDTYEEYSPEQEANNINAIEAVDIESREYYILPPPITEGGISVEEALTNRRSHRNFRNEPLTIYQVSQLLWAAYGITLPIPDAHHLRGGLRTTPSAGATYPLELYVVIGNVTGINPGVLRYISEEHKLVRVVDGDVRRELTAAALGQQMVEAAPISIFYSAYFPRITERYGERGIRYAYIELGHSAQNVYLQAEALGLGTVAIGAFFDYMVREILNLPYEEEPLYIMPIGYFY